MKQTIVFAFFSIILLFTCGQSPKSQVAKVNHVLEHSPDDQQRKGMELYVSNPRLNIFMDETRCFYPKGKYTENQLKNTEMLCDGALTINHPFEMLFESQNLNKKNLQAKTKEYIKACKLVEGEYWETLRKEYLNKYEFYTDFEKVKEEAVMNPAILKSSRFASHCPNYIVALNGSDSDLKAMWAKEVETQAAKSSLRASILKQFEEDSESETWRFIAREYIIVYGWGNCVNHKVYDEKLFFNLPENVEDKFRDLFDEIEEVDYHEHEEYI